jgi:general secretion pathway protein D
LAGGPPNADRTAARAVYDPLNDSTHNIPAGNYETPSRGPRYMEIAADNAPTPARAARPAAEEPGQPAPSAGFNLFRQGEDALRAHDKDQAYKFFVQAANYMNELDPATQQRLKEVLQLLSPPLAPRGGESPNRTLADDAAAKQAVLAKQVFTELAQQESAARVMFATDPKGALKLLEEAKKKVEGAGLEPNAREQLLRRVDRAMADMQRAIDQNRPQIDLAERNNRVRGEIEREQRSKIETQDKVKLMVDEFNRLMDEQRFAEAEVVAKRAAELAPQEPVVPQMLWQAKFVRRFMSNKALQANKEDLAWKTWDNVEQSAVPFDDNNPYQHGDARRWEQLTRNRARFLAERRRHRSEREMEIERKLRTSVSLAFKDAPLSKVIDYLAKVSEVNIVLDPQGLSQEGITTDTPVTIEVRNEIMLKSALNLVLEPLHLSYVVKDEVLKVTSESLRDGQIYTVTYNVADLVVPIPNFVPNPRMGLAGAYHDAMGQVGMGGGLGGNYGGASTPLAVVASKSGTPSQAVINPAVLAQMPGGGSGPGAGSSPVGFGPGGLGGGAQADFDSIIELITSTIHPRSWDAVGGPGTVTAFPTNLSIVVSQTQETHEEIVDLLEQLRRLQDLQVTIEVRFITLNDNFFERIGVDFDFNIDDNIDARPGQGFGRIVGPPPALGLPPIRDFQNIDNSKNVTVGLTGATGDAGPSFAADLDIPYRQNSFGLAVPQFGGFDASAGATLGFAILSDIEAFFFINAASGDRRSNVLQAPKVTLFNGQQAYVSDTSQTPFVISVVPVVGDFAAAQQPVIVVLSEGTHMTVQAVVSNDRRFVRLTVVPFFSRIGDVRTFQFTGSQTTTTDTGADGWVNGLDPNNTRRNNNRNNVTQTNNGTTVQLPTFSFVTVTTTVSVPDGGTVLLGGIKRLREGRNEFGVPILSKIPYLNRLFKNTAIGRETQSLMMMVTPRIIIQEEEEENLGVPVTSSRPTTNTTRMR